MKNATIGIVLAALLLVGVGSYAAYYRIALPSYRGTTNDVQATEESLASADVLMLASLDVAYLRALEARLYGTPQLPDLTAPRAQATSVMDDVRRSLTKYYSHLLFATAGLYLTSEGLSTVLVVGGDDQLSKAFEPLKNRPDAKTVDNLPGAWTIQTEDIDTCEVSRTWTFLIQQNRLIVTNARDTRIIERLKSGAAANRDLARWREFRQNRFAAAAVFVPSTLPEQGVDPMARAMAKGSEEDLKEFEAVYLGASTQAFLPRADLSLWLSTKRPDTAEQKAREWQAALDASRVRWQRSLPTFATLHERAVIASRPNLLTADVRIDKALIQQLANVPAEMMTLLFSGFDVKTNTASGPEAAPQERLETKPIPFLAAVTPNLLKPYDATQPFAVTPDVTVGPFGIYVDAVRASKHTPKVTEIEIAANGTQLPNLGEGYDAPVELSIHSVKDAAGKELLRVESCGRERNTKPATAKRRYDQQVEVKKTIRLAEDTGAHDAARIEGSLRFHLPTRVETVALPTPSVGDRLERDNLRVEVTRASGNSIGYRVSGEKSRLIHVQAKNAKGQVLASGSRSSFGNEYATSVSHEFHGQAASVEFVVARKIDTLSFPFALTSALPRVTEPKLRPAPLAFAAYAPAQLKQDLAQSISIKRFSQPKGSVKAGPGVVDLDHAQSFMGLNLQLSLYLPKLRNLEGALTATEMEIDSLTFNDGSVQRAVETKWQSFVPMTIAFGNETVMSGRAQIETGLKLDNKTVQALSGRISLRQPVALKPEPISAKTIGQPQESGCGPVTVVEIARSHMTVEGAGDPACTYAIRAFDGQGKELFVSDTAIKRTPAGWEAKLGITGIPEKLELVTVSKVQPLSYSFNLTVGEGLVDKPRAANPSTTGATR